MYFSSLRSNCLAAVIQSNERSVHATEWWNGEGIDFTFDPNDSDETKRIELHIGEITDLISIAIAMGFVDIEECTTNAEKMKIKELEHNQTIEKMKLEQTHEL